MGLDCILVTSLCLCSVSVCVWCQPWIEFPTITGGARADMEDDDDDDATTPDTIRCHLLSVNIKY